MRTIINPLLALLALASAMLFTSCDNDESYADRLNEERNAVNAYLSTKRVIMSVPEDTIFETGEDAPFYRLDNDGNIYMQVLKAGDRVNDRVKEGEAIYFRYSRYSLESWYADGTWSVYSGNENAMDANSCYFNYADFTLPVSSQWGYGIQYPLVYLGVECEVNLIIKSQYGITDEISYVMPFLYHVRYFHSMI